MPARTQQLTVLLVEAVNLVVDAGNVDAVAKRCVFIVEGRCHHLPRTGGSRLTIHREPARAATRRTRGAAAGGTAPLAARGSRHVARCRYAAPRARSPSRTQTVGAHLHVGRRHLRPGAGLHGAARVEDDLEGGGGGRDKGAAARKGGKGGGGRVRWRAETRAPRETLRRDTRRAAGRYRARPLRLRCQGLLHRAAAPWKHRVYDGRATTHERPEVFSAAGDEMEEAGQASAAARRGTAARAVVLAGSMIVLVAVAAVLLSSDARPSLLVESSADLVRLLAPPARGRGPAAAPRGGG